MRIRATDVTAKIVESPPRLGMAVGRVVDGLVGIRVGIEYVGSIVVGDSVGDGGIFVG